MKDKIILSSHYGNFHQTEKGYQLVFERNLDHPAEKVWKYLTQPEKMALWLSPNIEKPQTEIDLREGGKISIQFMMAVPEGTITKLEKEKILEINWGSGHTSRWELISNTEDNCTLKFFETLPESISVEAIAAWHGYLDFLEMSLNGIEIPADVPDRWNYISQKITARYKKNVIGEFLNDT